MLCLTTLHCNRSLSQVERAARNRPNTPYEILAKLLSLQPPPIAVDGLEDLNEAAAAATAWRVKYYTTIGLPAAAAAAEAGLSGAAMPAAVAGAEPDEAAADGDDDAQADSAAPAAAAVAPIPEVKGFKGDDLAAVAAAAAAARAAATAAAAAAAISAAFPSVSSALERHSSSDSDSSMADLMEAALSEPLSAAAAAAAAASAAAFAGKRFDVQMLQDLADEVRWFCINAAKCCNGVAVWRRLVLML
jgi:hypothetical protein